MAATTFSTSSSASIPGTLPRPHAQRTPISPPSVVNTAVSAVIDGVPTRTGAPAADGDFSAGVKAGPKPGVAAASRPVPDATQFLASLLLPPPPASTLPGKARSGAQAATATRAAGGVQIVYPPCNLPAALEAMGPYIQHSPLLRDHLEKIKQAGWSIGFNHGQGSQCVYDQKRIELDQNQPLIQQVQALAHEARHALQAPCYMQNCASAAELLAQQMEREQDAVAFQLIVRAQIRQNGAIDLGPNSAWGAYYEAAIDFYFQHRDYRRLLNHLGRMYVWEPTSVDGLTYWQSYTNSYQKFRGLPLVAGPNPEFLNAERARAMYDLQFEKQAAAGALPVP